MLKTEYTKYYKVKDGQTIEEIAEYFSVSPYLLARENQLTEAPFAGQILKVPRERGHSYVVQTGDSKAFLCGSAENYEKWNGTSVFYIGMKIIVK
jgi:LysM repeat protein